MKKFDWFLSTLRKSPSYLRGRRIPRRMTNHRGQAMSCQGEFAGHVERLEDRSLLSAVWIPQGPTTVLNGQVEGITNGEVIGAVYAVLAHPTDANIMYLGSVNGGVWKTTNATSPDPTWTPISDQQKSLSIGAMAMDSANPDRILVGYGRFSNFGNEGGDLTGLALTTNGGNTWTELSDAVLSGTISAASNTGPIVISTASAHGLGTGTQIQISGVTGNTAANGNFIITKLSDTTFSLDNSIGNGNYVNGGNWRASALSGRSVSGLAVRGEMILATASPFYDAFGGNYGGGLFRRADASSGFVAIKRPDGQPFGGLFDLVDDPSNPNRFYVAGQAGIFRSDDAGLTWVNVSGAAASVINARTNNLELAVHSFTGNDANPDNDTNAVYAVVVNDGVAAGIFRSDDGVDGLDNNGMNGTDEAGETNFVAMDVPVSLESQKTITDASNASPIVITSANHGLRTGNQVQISGVSGNTAANGTFTVTVLTLANGSNDPNRFSLNGPTSGSPTVGNGNYLGGGTWRQLLPLQPRFKPGGQGATNLSVVADPTNPFVVYVGGDRQDDVPNSVGANDFTGRLFRGDASVTPLGTQVTVGVPNSQWTPLTHIGTATNSAPHADSRDMVFDAAGNLVEVDDGGVYRRTSPQSNSGDWFSIIGNGLQVTEIHNVAYDSNSNVLISGTQDNGTAYQLTPGGSLWYGLSKGDGGDVAVDNVTLAASGQSIRYTSTQNLDGFQRTVWNSIGGLVSTMPISPVVLSGGNAFVGQFTTPIALNEVNPARLILGGNNSVYESFTQGDTITEIGPGITASAIAYGGRQGGVNNPDVLYVAQGSTIFVRTAAGGALTAAATLPTGTLPTGIDTIKDIKIDPNDWARAWVTDSNQVFQTVDAGATWAEITGTGPTNLATVSGHASDPQFQTIEYVGGSGTDLLLVGGLGGVFMSTDIGGFQDWSRLGTGLPNALVWDMEYDATDDVLAVGTLGRGAWTIPAFTDSFIQFARALGGPGHDDPVGIARTTDGGYVVAGTTTSISGNTADLFASKFNVRGDLLWSRTYAGSFFVPTPGGTAGPLTFDYATDIEPTSDGGVVVTGYTRTSPGAGGSGLRVVIDSNGDVVGGSTQTFGLSDDNLTSAADGGNLIGGNVTLNFYREVRVGFNTHETVLGAKTFAVINGNLYGTKSEISDFHSGHTTLRQLIKTSAGQTAVVGTQGGGLNFKTIVYTDDAGIVGLGSDDEAGVGIVETPADVSGNRYYGVLSSPIVFGSGTGNPDVVVRKLDTSLNVIWERTFPGAAGAIEATSDGGFVIASLAAFNRVQLVRLNAGGELVWAKQYDGRGTEGTTGFVDDIDLIATPHGFVFTVPTTSFGDNDANTEARDFWVVKTDADGNVPIMTGLMTDITAGFPLTTFTSSTSSAEWFLLPGPLYDNFEDPPGPPPEEGDFDYIEYSNFYLPQNGTILSSVVAAPANGAPREQSTPFYNAGSFQFETSTYLTTEDSSFEPALDIIVTRTDATHGSYGAARVHYRVTYNGSTSSGDFNISEGLGFLDFADGQTSLTAFHIDARSDNDFDPLESITITLLDPDPLNGAVIGTRASTTITALNTNPRPGTVQFTSATYTVNENKPSITITVERPDATETDMEVSYAITGGTATGGAAGVPGRDYETDHQTSGTFLFASGNKSQSFTIPIIDDPDVEGDETILLALSNPTNGGLLGTNATATVTIRDIQPPPPLEIVPKFNGKIAFVGPFGEERDTELLVMDANGANVTNLSNSTSLFESSPAWSPDGSKLAFAASGQNAMGDDISGIYVVNADGTGLNRITTSFRDTDPVWSPDGSRIAYVHGDPFAGDQLVTIDPDGTDPDILITVIGVLLEPKWAPDGGHITYQGRPFSEFGTQLPPTLVEIGVDGFGARVLFPSFSTTFDGSYTPDGTQMVFRGTLDSDDAIFRANVDGSGTPERLTDPVDSPFLSPDGTRLAYFTPGFEAFVAVSNIDGSGATSLSEGYFPGDPAWQPLLSNPEPDTQAPSVVSVTPSVATITDDFIGEANFSLTVVFSEVMNQAFVPTISFPTENPLSTLTFNVDDSGWTSSTTYVAKYDVTDAGKTLSNIDVRVTGGKDLAGNSHNATTSADEFSIAMAGTFHDMTPPKLTSIQRSNPSNQQTTASTLVFLVSFDEEIDPTTLDPSDFVVNGSTATVVSVAPDLSFGAIFSEVTVSGGNLASFNGSVGLSLNPNTDIVDAVGNPLSLMPPEVSEVYLHSSGTPNRVPSFTKGANQTVAEDSGAKAAANWATNISAGTGDIGQVIDFLVTNSNTALFSSQPAISHNGTLMFTPAENAIGTATVTVRIHDDGGTANGGVDTSAAQTFTITVTAVNDAPSFTLENVDIDLLEDAPAQTVNGFVTQISKGAADESGQTLSFLVTNDNPSLFSKAPAISATGVLTYTLTKDVNGTATVTVKAKDNGGVANGGVDTSEEQTFTINVTPVNDAPTFKKGADQATNEDVAVTVNNWATLINAGATNESEQELEFLVTTNNDALFAVSPSISENGTLTYTPTPNANGVATVTVQLQDDGDGVAPNANLSTVQTFKITIKPVNDTPTSSGIAPVTIDEDTSSGPIAFTVGDVETPVASLALKALSSTNTKLIPLTGIVLGGSGANRTLTINPAPNQFGSATIAFTIKDANGGVLTQNVLVTVNPVNDGSPTISNILDVTVVEDTPTKAIAFTVDDVDDKLVNLNGIVVTAMSSNADLVPNLPANIVLGGSAGKRTILLKPALDQTGTTTITVVATDSSGATATDTFVLTVNAVNDAPRVTVATFNISEFTAIDTMVGTVAAVDPEGNAITSFAITGGNTGNAFKIDAATGVIRVNDATKIDFEALAKYTLTIKATDTLGAAGTKANETGPVTINVEDQDFALVVDPVDAANIVTVLKVGNNLVARRGLVDVITPTSLDDVSSLTINGGTANDTVVLDASLNSAGTPATKKFTGQIVINGNGGDDRLDASKVNVATFGVVFDGGNGNDTALGGAGHDTLGGGDGNDSLSGGAGNDQLTGGRGDDQLLGGAGNDMYLFADTDQIETDTLTEASNGGTDLLNFGSVTTNVTAKLTSEIALAIHTYRTIKTSATGTTKLAGNFENVIGGAGDDAILGNAAANSLLGGTGSDTIIGGAGNDTLRGGDGDDTVIGGVGNDQLFGDADTDLGLGGKGGPARTGTSKKDTGDVLDASIETINEAFATIFGFE